MKYPIWNSYCTAKRKGYEIEITNHVLEETYSLPLEIVRWGKKLDGKTNPYDIDKTIDRATIRSWLRTLESFDCIRKSRVFLKAIGTFMYSFYIPQKITTEMRLIAWFYNKILQISFLPMFVFGIYRFFSSSTYGEGGFYIGIIIGLISGVMLHEIGHACAALACPSGRLFEMGIGFSSFMPIGYAIVDITKVKNRFQRVQVNLAGVETNIFLCGLFLLLASSCGDACWDMFFGAAIQNGFLAALNITFGNGIDGANVISDLLGDRVGSFISDSKKLVWNKKVRQKALSSGITGYALVASAYILRILQLTIPAFYIWNILSVLEVI